MKCIFDFPLELTSVTYTAPSNQLTNNRRQNRTINFFKSSVFQIGVFSRWVDRQSWCTTLPTSSSHIACSTPRSTTLCVLWKLVILCWAFVSLQSPSRNRNRWWIYVRGDGNTEHISHSQYLKQYVLFSIQKRSSKITGLNLKATPSSVPDSAEELTSAGQRCRRSF